MKWMLTATLLISFASYAQDEDLIDNVHPKEAAPSLKLQTEKEIDQLLDRVVASIQLGKSKVGLDLLRGFWPKMTKEAIEHLESLTSSTLNITGKKFGPSTGTEKIRSCEIGNFLYKSQYVIKYQRGFLHWNFVFYNPGDGWVVDTFKFDYKDFTPLTESCT